jgi:hypothetical protein
MRGLGLRLRSIENRIKRISGDEPLDFDITPALGRVVYQPRPVPPEYLWVMVKTFRSIGLHGEEPLMTIDSIDELKKYCEDSEGYSRKEE